VSSRPDQVAAGAELSALRDEIERIDRALVDLLAERVRIGRRVARAKRHAGLPVLDPGREAEIVRRAAVRAREQDLPDETVREIFWRIIGLTRRSQTDTT
jgi:chorismate mutase